MLFRSKYIAKSNNDVTAKFIGYLRPLLGSGMMPIGRLDPANRVRKILGK